MLESFRHLPEQSQNALFQTVILPVLEDARQQLTAKGIECSLTNGQSPQSKETRHGLTLQWRGTFHSSVFQSMAEGIHPVVTFRGEERRPLTDKSYEPTVAAVEAVTFAFIEYAFG